ncbi:hypothetical protein [Xanthomonas oryzae]|uniref:hypothetical protein n=1 Tax=Xanthomonas oryzae TaxID=347 RepID=UPI001F08796A|nr:hypothetical protein [Xanthomonas oryzae]
MARLVIEEDVRLQHSEDLALLNSAEKECIVCHDAPTFKRAASTLDRNTNGCEVIQAT